MLLNELLNKINNGNKHFNGLDFCFQTNCNQCALTTSSYLSSQKEKPESADILEITQIATA